MQMEKGNFGFLIVGAGRGGTSLLMGMLDSHSELEVAMEIHAMDCLLGYSMDIPSAEYRHEIAQVRSNAFLTRCQEYAKNFPEKYFGNKITTEQIYGLHDHVSANGVFFPYMQELFLEALDGVRVIYILRDGRTNVRSKLQRTAQSMEHAVARYRFGLQVLAFLQQNHPNFLLVKYENLVREPRETLFRVCSFLGVQYEDSMLSGVGNVKMPGDYRSEQLDVSKLHLKKLPAFSTQLLLQSLKETGYMGKWEWLYNRIRYSTWWFFVSLALLTGMALLGIRILLN